MQFKIPQNVQREDTIIGPITMKQLIICGVGGGIAYAIYVSLSKLYFWEVWLWPVAIITGITLTVAFVKIHDIPSYKFVLLLLEYFLLPRKRTWIKGGAEAFESLLSPYKMKPKKDRKVEEKQQKDMEKINNLSELSKILDTHGEMTLTEQK